MPDAKTREHGAASRLDRRRRPAGVPLRSYPPAASWYDIGSAEQTPELRHVPGTAGTPGRRGSQGFTFIELLVVTTIVMILASAVMPLARVSVQRQNEAELRRYLREMRTAIDKFKDAADAGAIGAFDIKAGSEGYPPSLETLVEGVSVVNDQSGRKLKFLRKIPIDPMTKSTDWGLRSYQDRPDARTWGGQNVYDVYTKSEGTALDGTKYRDW